MRLSVGHGQPTDRPGTWVGRPFGRPTGVSVFSFQDSDFVSELETNPIGVS